MVDKLTEGIVAAGIDAVPLEVAILDAEGTIVLVNEAWRRFADDNHGTDIDYWVGTNYLDVSRQAYDDPRAADVVDGLRALLDGSGEPLRVEYPCHSPEQHRWFMVDASGFSHAGDRYAIVTHHNITDRKLAEIQSAARQDQLAALLGVLTHDIRNPLNVIEGYAELLATELGETPEIESIRRAAVRISEITEATLAFTQSGALSTVEPVQIGEVAREAWRTVDTGDAALTVRETPTVHGDRRLLLQLFENLFRNAVEHAGADCAVTVGPLPTGFYVEDNGPGVPESVREPAFLADFSTQGTGGLGLAIIQSIVQAHGGVLVITDGPGGGARFEVQDIDVAPT